MGSTELSFLALAISLPILFLLYRRFVRLELATERVPPKRQVAAADQRSQQTNESAQDEYTRLFFKNLLGPSRSDRSREFSALFRDHWEQYLDDPGLYPRQPLVLPKLLQAMKSESNSSKALVEIVMEDPGLTSEVLKLANSPLYRNTKSQVHSIEYALVMLGIDGLHALVCSTLTKPIFARRKNDGFNAVNFWEWSLVSAQNAQHLAAFNHVNEPTVPYMLALLTRLSELTILRICTRLSQEKSQPFSTSGLIQTIDRYRYLIATRLIKDWGFDNDWLNLLPHASATTDEKSDANDLSRQHILRAQRLAPELASALVLIDQKKITEEQMIQHLQSQGLAQRTIRELTARLD